MTLAMLGSGVHLWLLHLRNLLGDHLLLLLVRELLLLHGHLLLLVRELLLLHVRRLLLLMGGLNVHFSGIDVVLSIATPDVLTMGSGDSNHM